MPEVTVACMIYKSIPWLDFVLEGIDSAYSDTGFEMRVFANDPTDEVASDPRVTDIVRHKDPDSWYLARVYNCWNEAVIRSKSPWVVLLNSDMYVSDGWLDVLLREARSGRKLPTSLLVESGRILSAFPEHVCDLGTDPKKFDRSKWSMLATEKREDRVSEGRLFMPVCFNREAFIRVGGYPMGNIGGMSGDKILFNKLGALGFKHVTCHGSVVYHAQEGEMRS